MRRFMKTVPCRAVPCLVRATTRTCWGGYCTAASKFWRPLQDALGLPEGDVCVGTILVGYPKYRHRRMPLRNTPQISWF